MRISVKMPYWKDTMLCYLYLNTIYCVKCGQVSLITRIRCVPSNRLWDIEPFHITKSRTLSSELFNINIRVVLH